jgi:hypothetical protein
MGNCINNCINRLLPGLGYWAAACIVAAIIAVFTGNATLGAASVTVLIAVGAAAAVVAVYC